MEQDILIVALLIFGMLIFAYLFLPLSVEYIAVTGIIMFVLFLLGMFLSKNL